MPVAPGRFLVGLLVMREKPAWARYGNLGDTPTVSQSSEEMAANDPATCGAVGVPSSLESEQSHHLRVLQPRCDPGPGGGLPHALNENRVR